MSENNQQRVDSKQFIETLTLLEGIRLVSSKLLFCGASLCQERDELLAERDKFREQYRLHESQMGRIHQILDVPALQKYGTIEDRLHALIKIAHSLNMAFDTSENLGQFKEPIKGDIKAGSNEPTTYYCTCCRDYKVLKEHLCGTCGFPVLDPPTAKRSDLRCSAQLQSIIDDIEKWQRDDNQVTGINLLLAIKDTLGDIVSLGDTASVQ